MSDFSIRQGDTYTENWTVTDNVGAAIDITGGKLWLTIKTNYTQADPGALQLSSPSNGIAIVSAPAGTAKMTITNTQSASLTSQTYVYDVQFKDSNGVITTLDSGSVTVLPEVTTTTS